MQQEKKDIRSLSEEEILEVIQSYGEKPFRAKQINEWIWKKGAISFEEMRNIPAALQEKLAENYSFFPLKIMKEQRSRDKTIKLLMHTYDAIPLEAVLIPTKNRVTACISTQTGCVLDCSFCATAKINKFRNLTVAEIINQVFFIDKLARDNFGKHLTNVVIMGMGEAFLNYAETSKALNILTDTKYWAWSPSRITLSTAGIVPKIKAFALDHPKIQLAISLHAANDEKRSAMMPVNTKYNLAALREALTYYHKQTNNRITLEYLMLKEVNDSLQDAAELAEFCKAFPVKINLIRYNTVETSPFKASDEKSVEAFAEFLENKKNLIVTIRQSRGEDIAAACGQLANKS